MGRREQLEQPQLHWAHHLRGLEEVEGEAQERGGMVWVRLGHPCGNHEPMRASVKLVDLAKR